MLRIYHNNNNNNNTSICKAHNVSIRAESEAPAKSLPTVSICKVVVPLHYTFYHFSSLNCICYYYNKLLFLRMLSVLLHHLLGDRNGIQPVGTPVMVILQQLCMQVPVSVSSCCINIQNGLTFWYRLVQVVLAYRPLNTHTYSVLNGHFSR